MILEQNISLWVQLSGSMGDKYVNRHNCDKLSNFLGRLSDHYDDKKQNYIHTVKNIQIGIDNTRTNTKIRIDSDNRRHDISIFNYEKWPDFQVPSTDKESLVELLSGVQEAVKVLKTGGVVAVSCGSGRGRSGTFIALVMGMLESIKSHSELVDIVVQMRENRDGLLETPQQFRFAALFLNLNDTRQST